MRPLQILRLPNVPRKKTISKVIGKKAAELHHQVLRNATFCSPKNNAAPPPQTNLNLKYQRLYLCHRVSPVFFNFFFLSYIYKSSLKNNLNNSELPLL